MYQVCLNPVIPTPKDFSLRAVRCNDFCGIAISPIISKMFKYCFLKTHDSYLISSNNQFGFKKGLSCRNVIYTVRSIVANMYAKAALSTDLSKTFDKVNHNALYTVIHNYRNPWFLLYSF